MVWSALIHNHLYMTHASVPYFTEEYSKFYLWRPEPLASKIKLAGEFRTIDRMQKMSKLLFGVRAKRRAYP